MIDPVALGATLYIPADHPHLEAILHGERLGQLRSVIVCTEDALAAAHLEQALIRLRRLLPTLHAHTCLHFVRARNPGVLARLLEMPGAEHLSGFVLPKCTLDDVKRYEALLSATAFCVMPVIETQEAFETERLRALRDALHAGEKCYLVASLGRTGAEKRQTVRCLALADGSVTGEFPYPRQWLDVLIEKASRSTYPVVQTIEGERFVIERCFVPSTIFIYGAGHVSQQVALLAEMVGFQTVVLDDRSEYANRDRFPKADSIKVLDSFEGCFAGLEPDGDSYVVIVTRGHSHDKTVLAQALQTGAGYIGMMGSRRKREELFKVLQQEGFDAGALERVHCPIGLDIKAATTGEIAVSIIAELLQTRAQASG
jgi:hypothetical protein